MSGRITNICSQLLGSTELCTYDRCFRCMFNFPEVSSNNPSAARLPGILRCPWKWHRPAKQDTFPLSSILSHPGFAIVRCRNLKTYPAYI
ncbi:hypothetical protein WUBG_08917 [Wuchereria bancrofti]|uniref:Uncharacterized protein n=1 Tax=Wuchereria bancrofti TaxID=6293 RepID=J9EYE2_WUCBA|nr:hypothetical protein WUBG_08917 [Wuchereria bancrofti]